jgi:hypothetical protein
LADALLKGFLGLEAKEAQRTRRLQLDLVSFCLVGSWGKCVPVLGLQGYRSERGVRTV